MLRLTPSFEVKEKGRNQKHTISVRLVPAKGHFVLSFSSPLAFRLLSFCFELSRKFMAPFFFPQMFVEVFRNSRVAGRVANSSTSFLLHFHVCSFIDRLVCVEASARRACSFFQCTSWNLRKNGCLVVSLFMMQLFWTFVINVKSGCRIAIWW